MASYVVRFSEFDFYNINEDEDWVRFMATMDRGSYFVEVPRGKASDLRKNRAAFKELVIDAIKEGLPPMELEMT